MKLVSKVGFSLLACTLLTGSAGTGIQAASILPHEKVASQSVKAAIEPIISKISMVHYNVARVELKTPINALENYINIGYSQDREVLIGAKPVYDEDGTNYIAFDINLDELAHAGLNTQGVANSLVFISASYTGGTSTLFPIPNEELKYLIRDAIDQGEIQAIGDVDINTMFPTMNFNTYLDETNLFADHVLNGKITTLSHSIQININQGFTEGYHYRLTDSSGKEVQRVFVADDALFINLGDNTFNNEQYTLTVQKEGETDSIVLLYFTPFNIF